MSIRNISLGQEALVVVSSNTTLSNVTVTNITFTTSTDFIFGLLQSNIQVMNVTYTDSTLKFLNTRNSKVGVNTLNFENITSRSSLLSVSTSDEAEINTLNIANSSTQNKEVITIHSTSSFSANGITINGIHETCLTIINTQAPSLSGLDLKG